jgi:hypothetical protein
VRQVTLLEAGLRASKAAAHTPRRERRPKQVALLAVMGAALLPAKQFTVACMHGKLKKPWLLQAVSPSKRRASTRLANLPPENRGLTGDERECHGVRQRCPTRVHANVSARGHCSCDLVVSCRPRLVRCLPGCMPSCSVAVVVILTWWHHAGRLVLEEQDAAVQSGHEARWAEFVSQHRCDSQSRGSVYDSRAGKPTLASLHGCCWSRGLMWLDVA